MSFVLVIVSSVARGSVVEIVSCTDGLGSGRVVTPKLVNLLLYGPNLTVVVILTLQKVLLVALNELLDGPAEKA